MENYKKWSTVCMVFVGKGFSEVALFCSLEYVRVSVCLSHEVPFLHLWLLYLLFLYYTYCS